MDKKVSLRQISVYTGFYERNHEKKPRGLGVWIFSIGSYLHSNEMFIVNEVMLYSKALEIAKREAQRRGVYSVYVLP